MKGIGRQRVVWRGALELMNLGKQPLRNTVSTQCMFLKKTPARCLSTTRGIHQDSTRIVQSHFDPLPLPNISFPELLMEAFERKGSSEAFYDVPTSRTLTYSDLKDSVIRVASGLTKLGIRKGDVISICALNSPEFIILCLAVSCTGGVLSAINPQATPDDLLNYLRDCKAKAIVTFPEFVPMVNGVKPGLKDLKNVIVFGGADGCLPFSSLLSDDGRSFPDQVEINPEKDVILMPYSSGTTGLPKGVMLTHHNIVSNVVQFRKAFPAEEPDKMFCYLPYFHIYGLMNTISAIISGISMVTVPRFDPQTFLSVIEQQKVSILNVVPPVCLFMAKHPASRSTDLSSVRICVSGGATLSPGLTAEFQEATGIKNTMQGYGLTECPVGLMDEIPDVPGSIGRLVPNTSAKIVDITDGTALGVGENGELCIKGPQVMTGYFQNPQATADTLVNGWLHTGDIGHVDENGYFFIHDRLKELIKYKGFQVPPAQLEAVLLSHPMVRDAAVIGVPDDEAGELPKAYVVSVPGETPSAEDIIQYVNGKVAQYKHLRGGVEFIQEIPKSASGKILRRLLKDA